MQDLSITTPVTIEEWDARQEAGLDVWYSFGGEIVKASLKPSELHNMNETIKFYITTDD